uniref:Transposase n=1 Tax=Strongyloides venezuelensis TaxID=75913 RepID=A0A0K0FVJ1_STRVS
MDTFNRFHHLLSEPKKIAAFSFDENGNVIDNETENQVFLKRSVLTREDVNIDLKQNHESYNPQVGKFKSLFISNILMELDKRTGRRLKESLMGSDFFTTRGILIALAGGRKQKPFISWGFVIRGVIVLVSDKKELS